MFKRKPTKTGKHYMHWTYSWDLNHILPLCVLLYFSEMNNLHSLLLTVVQGAADIPDPQVRVHVRVHVKVHVKVQIKRFIHFHHQSIRDFCLSTCILFNGRLTTG